MGNKTSSPTTTTTTDIKDEKAKYRSFPGSAILEKAFCGSIDTTDPSEYQDVSTIQRLFKRADKLCVSSPVSDGGGGGGGFRSSLSDDDDDENDNSLVLLQDFQSASPLKKASKKSGVLLARALVSEVTNNPKTMKPAEMAAREKKLLKAQTAASAERRRRSSSNNNNNTTNTTTSKPVGAVGPPHMLRSMAYACTGDANTADLCVAGSDSPYTTEAELPPASPFRVEIGVCLSRRSSTPQQVGHPATITRQTAYDFNLLQDRSHKYVSSTSGWKAGGGDSESVIAAPDNVHIAVSVIDCPNQETVDAVITALASGEIFIPHMQILPPERLSSNTVSPDITVPFSCERSDQDGGNPEEWPNWCLEFMHNQLYEYFYSAGARWMPRPFSITLANSVRWKTVKHMNRYFSNAEKVLQAWRELGPQYLEPDSIPSNGAAPEEVAHPHGIYLFRNGVPTNYFAPNFEPPYTTKMTRSLLMTVLDKSYDKKRREWTSAAVPRVVEPVTLLTAACGCTDNEGGFMAREVTTTSTTTTPSQRNSIPPPSSIYPRTHSEMEFGVGGGGGSGSSEKENHEEKKSDDATQQQQQRHYLTAEEDIVRGSSSSSGKPRRHRHSRSSSDHGNTPSIAHASVAESGTTVMHTNVTCGSGKNYKSPVALLHHHHDGLFSDEDFLNGASPRLSPRLREALEDKQNINDGSSSSSSSDDNNNRSPANTKTMQTQAKMDREKVASNYTMHASTSSPTSLKPKSSLEQTSSLEYSMDGSSAFFAQDQSLIGQHFEEVKQQTGTATRKQQQKNPTIEEEEEEESMLSLQSTATGSSVQSVVPTDEELFVVGWAKALDPNSGNYYYFTLDRTRTVWENPLSSSTLLDHNGELPPPGKQQQQKAVDP